MFGQTFRDAAALKRWNDQRGAGQAALVAKDLITNLNVLPDMPPQIPLNQYGLGTSPDGARVRGVFPDFFTDPIQGQASLAFLLFKYRVSVAVTLGPDFNVAVGGPNGIANPPLAFDFSHNDHRSAQAYMWARILATVDKLIDLLKQVNTAAMAMSDKLRRKTDCPAGAKYLNGIKVSGEFLDMYAA